MLDTATHPAILDKSAKNKKNYTFYNKKSQQLDIKT